MKQIRIWLGLFTITSVFLFNTLVEAQQTVLDIPINGSVVDISSNHLAVMTNNGGVFVPDRFGRTNSAFALNGVNQNLSIPYDARLYPDEFTLSLWVNFKQVTGGLLRSGNVSSDGWRGYGIEFSSGSLYFTDFTGSGYNAVLTVPQTNFVAGHWYQVVVSRSSNSCAMYLNGVKMVSQTNLTPYAKPLVTPISLGAINNDPNGFFDYCPATLDTIHIYNHALSDSAVQSLYATESSSTNSPLVLDIPINGSVMDVSSNHFMVATNNGGVFVPDRFGQTNSAFALNGVNQNLSIPVRREIVSGRVHLKLVDKLPKSQWNDLASRKPCF